MSLHINIAHNRNSAIYRVDDFIIAAVNKRPFPLFVVGLDKHHFQLDTKWEFNLHKMLSLFRTTNKLFVYFAFNCPEPLNNHYYHYFYRKEKINEKNVINFKVTGLLIR